MGKTIIIKQPKSNKYYKKILCQWQRRQIIMNSSKTITDKIKSMSRMLSIILKFARIACHVSIGISVAGIIYLLLFGNANLMVFKGDVILRSPFSNSILNNIDTFHLIALIVAGIIGIALMANLFYHAQNIFKDISIDSSPFEMKQVKRIKRVAILYLIISLFDFQNSPASFTVSLNLVGIIGAFMFYCMALIFEYGCALQKESDEIL